ncbi:TB2/DP1, HVA22 family-domain-containing protein [Gymnopilus junonius]|uniref:Protein YOP1 n=1 Tax=Gymnopilus junonius TaxID=109634 RepID=A0A9P5TRX8_GYMJU|nr:TB2/DP1, HVA22 family-domain-containing protein [Gymnopilus junonius]
MLFSLTSRIVSALAAFLYPGYASYKTLSQRPASEADLERWLMYWSVLGCVVGVEYLAEWLVSWIPLYSTFKAIFLLYLALPQTQGSTYIYLVHLRPFFATHEKQIDSAIAEIRGRAYRFIQEKARTLWAALIGALAPGGAGGQPDSFLNQPANPTGQPPTPGNQPTGPTQLLSSLWTSYGPGIIAGGAALLRQTAAATLPGQGAPGGQATADARALNTPSGSGFFNPALDPAERRRQLEAELASMSAFPPSTSSVPIPPANNPARPNISPSSSSSSGSGLRERTMSSGKFEEIRGNDVEGYEVEEEFVGGFVAGGESATAQKRTTSWFGGWGSASGKDEKGAYERVKSE